MTRWMHPPELERRRELAQFDPAVEGARFGLSHELAARIAARGGRLWPDVGRVTRVDIEAHGVPLAVWSGEYLAPRAPGRQTLVSADAASRHLVNEVAPAHRASAESPRTELPGASAVMPAMDALQ